jgi:hypothetical protein
MVEHGEDANFYCSKHTRVSLHLVLVITLLTDYNIIEINLIYTYINLYDKLTIIFPESFDNGLILLSPHYASYMYLNGISRTKACLSRIFCHVFIP